MCPYQSVYISSDFNNSNLFYEFIIRDAVADMVKSCIRYLNAR